MTNRDAMGRIRFIIVALIVLTVALVVGRGFQLRATVRTETIDVNGLNREYRLVIPESLASRKQYPLLIALHGAIDRTDEMAASTGLDELAVEKEFVLVYPQGKHLNWQPEIPEENPDVMRPDLEFFEALCDRMVQQHQVDPQRIYVLGVSQGGGMSTVLTAFCSERIAATICICGWLPDPLGSAPLETRYKCPMLFVVGENDNQVSPSSTRAAHDAFAAAGHPVEYLVIPNYGHGWPRDAGINEIAWQFLSKQRQTTLSSQRRQEEAPTED